MFNAPAFNHKTFLKTHTLRKFRKYFVKNVVKNKNKKAPSRLKSPHCGERGLKKAQFNTHD